MEWNLTDFFKSIDDPAIEKNKKTINKLVSEFIKKYKGKINSPKLTATLLLQSIKDVEAIDERLYIYTVFADSLFNTNTKSNKNRLFYQQSKEFSTKISSDLTWYMLEWQALPEKKSQQILKNHILSSYQHFFAQARAFAPFRLSEPEEVILTKKSQTSRSAFVRLYDEEEALDRYDGATYSEIVTTLRSEPNRELRKKAALAITKTLQQKEHLYTFILNTLLLDKKVSDEMRGYKFPQQATFLDYEVDSKTVENIESAIDKNIAISQKFYAIKRKAMAVGQLYEWDRYHLLYPKVQQKYTWQEAKKIVLDAFAEFDEEFFKVAKLFFDKRWIDAKPNPDKRSGAYCSYTVPSKHPLILMSFQGSIDDVYTLAHELGHGIHGYLARKNSLVNFWSSTATAEIASTFCENLVFEYIFARTKNKKQKADLLCNQIQGSFATIFRQMAFYQFERDLHFHRREKGELTAEQIHTYFQKRLQPMFGKALKLTDGHSLWWMVIAHFYHYNFYVFTYSFGELLAYSLLQLYRKQDKSFITGYKDILRAGGTLAPDQLLAKLDLDISKASFWNEGMAFLAERVKQFDKIVTQA